MAELLDRVPVTLAASGTVWLMLGLIAAWLARRRPARAHSLLALATAGSIVTPVLIFLVQLANLGILPAPRPDASAAVRWPASLAAAQPVSPLAPEWPELAPGRPWNPLTAPAPQVTRPTSLPAASAPALAVPWRKVILSLWLILSTALGIRLVVDFLVGRRVVRSSNAVTDTVLIEAMQRASVRLGARRPYPQLRGSRAVACPALWGWTRPATILVPEAGKLPGDCEAVFCHEIAHLSRRDHWTALLAELLVCVLPWHPLSWLTRRGMDRCAEEACDDWAVACGCPPLDFAATLVNLAPTSTRALTVAAVSHRSLLTARVRRLVTGAFCPPRIGRGWLAGTIVGALVLATGWAIWQPRHAVAEPAAEGPATAKTANANANANVNVNTPPAAPRTVRVLVLDPHGQPLSGAKVHSGIWTKQKGFKSNHDYTTDATGLALVELPARYTIVRLWASKKPYVALFAGWEEQELNSGRQVPEAYTFRLESSVSAGGRVVDEHDRPIAGAQVQVNLANTPKPAGGDGRVSYNTWLAYGSDAATTDADGRWQIDNVPDDPQVKLQLLVSHPDHVSDAVWGESQVATGVTTAMLRQRTATLRLKEGPKVRGRVTDPSGQPVAGALVIHGNDPYFSSIPSEYLTDGDGRFQLPALRPGETNLTVVAAGWAPQTRRVSLRAGSPAQDFRLEPGKPIRLRVVDGAGKPVAGALVSIDGWKGIKALHNHKHPNVHDTHVPRETNDEGVWEWTWAPDDPVKLAIHCEGFTSAELETGPTESTRTIVLNAEHRVTGRVTDAVTGQPIPEFTVIPVNVLRKDILLAWRPDARMGKNGRLDYLATRTDVALRLRMEAPGYRTQDGPEFRVGEAAARTQDFRLVPGAPVTGQVVDAAGQPAAKAVVLLATPTQEANLSSEWGDFLPRNCRSTVDATGHFTFPAPGESTTLLAIGDAGFALSELSHNAHAAGTLTLKPWAAVRGRFVEGGKPMRGAHVLLQPIRVSDLSRPRIDALLQTVTDADGRFEFPRVPPLPVSVRILLGPWRHEEFVSGPSMPLDLQPGQQAELELGAGGATVTGRVALTGKVPAELDCAYSLNYLVSREQKIVPPPEIARLGLDVRNGWYDAWRESQEGQAYLQSLRYWFVQLAPDGRFRVSGVPPGKYDLTVAVYAKPSGCLVDPLARQAVEVTVTANDAGQGTLTLPDVTAEVVPVPSTGDMPELAYEKPDGTRGNLADQRGRYALVHFWASWCGPCKQQLPTLRRIVDRFGPRGLTTLGLSLDDDPAAWRAGLTTLGLPGTQGRLTAHVAGVSSVPAYWLLNPEGRIVAKAQDPDELTQTLAERLK